MNIIFTLKAMIFLEGDSQLPEATKSSKEPAFDDKDSPHLLFVNHSSR